MKNLHEAKLTKELAKEVEESIRFVYMPTLNNYDYITIQDDFIEISKEEKWERDENLEYNKISDREVRQFKRNNLSGVFVEC
ncbi:hypothetical protein [Clostridium sp. ZS2]|uniref:hypothetical protein n=1 Tax=Clostridium sp. ZS2 TaxID=2949988 RepID=UPI00207AB756|nr:hypothetical protein [Clostridium sp. ZS2]